MDYLTKEVNTKDPTVMFIDINSCFATVEQQANPLLRGKPVVVAAYTSGSGCILAASIEAKKLGIKGGMRVRDGAKIYPNLIVLPSDPDKYRQVHLALKRILIEYTNKLEPRSIDEFVLDMDGYPALRRGMIEIGREIKQRIKVEIGEWIMVSIGIGANLFWAKTASNLRKPDGLEVINSENLIEVYKGLYLMDLCGINRRNAARLNGVGIFTVTEFFAADISLLKSAFRSVNAYYWYWRLRGWEIDDVEFERRGFSQSYALPKPYISEEELMPILAKLTEKMTRRMRQDRFEAQGMHLGLVYKDGSYWHRGQKLKEAISVTADVFRQLKKMLSESSRKPVANLSVSVFDLRKKTTSQLVLFDDVFKNERATLAQDEINDVWGEYTIGLARMMKLERAVVGDRISFGGVRGLRN